MSQHGRSGPSTSVCQANRIIEWDYLDEVWRHEDDGQECNCPPDDDLEPDLA